MATATVSFDSFLPEGESLFDYQHVGVAYALVAASQGKGTWIADEQGLGKTRQAIVTAKVKGSKRILIVVKSSAQVQLGQGDRHVCPGLECPGAEWHHALRDLRPGVHHQLRPAGHLGREPAG